MGWLHPAELMASEVPRLETFASEVAAAGFARAVVLGIGGRYSALSNFGLLPAALLGIDPAELLASAARQVCAADDSLSLGEKLATPGKDKMTFFFSKTLAPFGVWLEQLIAESTGK